MVVVSRFNKYSFQNVVLPDDKKFLNRQKIDLNFRYIYYDMVNRFFLFYTYKKTYPVYV